MPTKKKTEIINWETKINKTHEILSKTIFELLFDSFCAGDLSEKELTLAKAFVNLKPNLTSTNLLLEKIHKIEVEFHKQDK